MKRKNTIVRGRAHFILSLFIVFSLALLVRMYTVQIVNGHLYSERADRQHTRPTAETFDRGAIFFKTRDGDKINAASLKSGFKIAINPRSITHPEDVYNNLGFYLDLNEEFYISRAGKTDDPYEEIASRVPYEVGIKIRDLDMNGVLVLDENWRYYPGGDLAAHAIGFTAFREDEIRGQYGLERQYDDVLSRDHGDVFSNFFVEIFSKAKDIKSGEKSVEGNLITTIDPDVQSFVDEEALNIFDNWGAKKIGIIVMDPRDGAVRAMSLFPAFDLNKFNLVEDSSVYSNDLISNVYEMGSIVKPLTMAIGIDVGAVTPQTTYNDTGSMTLNTETFYNYDHRGRGVVSMQEVLNQSLNTGVAFVVQKVGNAKFADFMNKMFAERTGVDLPNEAASLVSNLDSRNDIEYATASFGQGIAMSPISITRALAALGNGGKLVTPHLVERIEYDLGFSNKIDLPEPTQIFSAETSEEITRMLVNVVDEALRGGSVALKDYSIAAKTGTAQIARTDTAGYYEDRFLHSFFGYFPAYDPEFLVFLYHLEPNGARYASETLTEPFMNIAKFLINHYEIKADRAEVVIDQ